MEPDSLTRLCGRAYFFDRHGPLFLCRVGATAVFVRLLKLTARRAGIGHVSAHDLRRTHITLALDNGAPLQDMQAQDGHANTSTTQRYAQLSDARTMRLRDVDTIHFDVLFLIGQKEFIGTNLGW